MNYYQHLRTTNDRNGNPRRLWVFYNESGDIIRVIDEGFEGSPKTDAIQLTTWDITISEYKSTLRFAKEAGILEGYSFPTKMEYLGTQAGYDFYRGHTGDGKDFWNIVLEGDRPPTGGYFNREWIEDVKHVKFPVSKDTQAT